MLGFLPIALEQAAAYVRNTGLSFGQYKSLLHKYGLPMLPADFDHATDYRHSVQTICRLAFEAVQERSPMARILLDFVAFLSAESNCLLALMALATAPNGPLTTHLGGVQDIARLTSRLLDLVGTLQRYSLLIVDREKATIRVHRIVQMATRDVMRAEERQARLVSWSTALGFLLRGQDNSANWSFIEAWFAHARSVAEFVVSEGVDVEAAARFLEQISLYLEKHAHYQEGMRFATRSASIRESALSPASPKSFLSYAQSLTTLGIVHHRCNENDRAIAVLNNAIDILKSNLPGELSTLAAAMEILATVYVERAEIDKAEPLLKQLLDDAMLRSAAHRTAVSGALTAMAVIASKREEYETAASLTGEAIAVLEAEANPDMFNLAHGYNNLGAILAKSGRHDEAQVKYERALELYRAILPDSHPFIANLENNLGYLFFRRRLYGQALPLIYGSISRLARALGNDNPHTEQAAWNYLDCVEELKKRNIAVVFQEEIENGEYRKKIDSNTIGMVVVSSVPARDDGDSH